MIFVLAIVVGVAALFVGVGLLIDMMDRQNWPDGFPVGSIWG